MSKNAIVDQFIKDYENPCQEWIFQKIMCSDPETDILESLADIWRMARSKAVNMCFPGLSHSETEKCHILCDCTSNKFDDPDDCDFQEDILYKLYGASSLHFFIKKCAPELTEYISWFVDRSGLNYETHVKKFMRCFIALCRGSICAEEYGTYLGNNELDFWGYVGKTSPAKFGLVIDQDKDNKNSYVSRVERFTSQPIQDTCFSTISRLCRIAIIMTHNDLEFGCQYSHFRMKEFFGDAFYIIPSSVAPTDDLIELTFDFFGIEIFNSAIEVISSEIKIKSARK